MTTSDCNLECGELYIFTTRPNDKDRCIWGMFDCKEQNRIRLEVSSFDLKTFHHYESLPQRYRYCRRATRDELRDFFFNCGYFTSVRQANDLL